MEHSNRHGTLRRALGLLIAAAVAVAPAACGGSNRANQLLRQTFAGNHQVESGELGMLLTITPSGAGTARPPITLSLFGPFQSLGPGRLPASSFNVSLVAGGTAAGATITSTGSSGYVTFQGQSYKLPPATFQQLESTFAGLAAAPGTGNGSGMLGRLGLRPEHWLSDPQIVGDEGIEGVNTTHIRSGINVAALLADLNRFLRRASSRGIAGLPQGIAPADRRKIAREVKNASFNVWTGVADKTLRRLQIGLTFPVPSQLSRLLGRSATIGLTMQYAKLNQPQSITAPTNLLPYSQLQAKLRVLVQDVQSGLVPSGSSG